MKQLNPIMEKMNIILNLKEHYNDIMQKNISFDYENLNREVLISEVLRYCSRNDNLSEEGIYNRKPTGNKYIEVLSGATNKISYGRIDINSDGIHYLEDKQCIHLVSRGNAGKLRYIDKGTYATNTNAFLLYLKDEYKKEMNIDTYEKEKTILNFLIIYLQPIFFELTTSSDLSVFPLTEVMTNLHVPEISYSDRLKEIVETYEKIFKLVDEIDKIEEGYTNLLDKEILSIK